MKFSYQYGVKNNGNQTRDGTAVTVNSLRRNDEVISGHLSLVVMQQQGSATVQVCVCVWAPACAGSRCGCKETLRDPADTRPLCQLRQLPEVSTAARPWQVSAHLRGAITFSARKLHWALLRKKCDKTCREQIRSTAYKLPAGSANQVSSSINDDNNKRRRKELRETR